MSQSQLTDTRNRERLIGSFCRLGRIFKEVKTMAVKPIRPCNHAGCPALTREGYCPKHKRKSTRKASADYHSLYSLPVWIKVLRPRRLMQEPFCRECAKLGFRTTATVVDHIKPHEGDMALFCDFENTQSLCKHHHDAKTLAEQRAKHGKI